MIKTKYTIIKWCKSITDDHKDLYTHNNIEGLKYSFRLLDDDYIIYAYGKSNKISFLPLDHYMGIYGCTIIEYFNESTGKYEML